MANVNFQLVKKEDENGQLQDTLVRNQALDNGTIDTEDWCTISDLDRLFNACSRRWPKGWDLDKLLTCVSECDFD